MNNDCIFCKIANGELGSYTIYEDDYTISFLTIEPDYYGHALVIPKKHFVCYEDIDLETLNHVNSAGKKVFDLLNKKLNCHSIQLVQNNGKLQEVKHYHLHLIPFYDEETPDSCDFENVLNTILN